MYFVVGMIVIDDAHLADHICALRNLGRGEDEIYLQLRFKNRFDETNAAVVSALVEHIQRWSGQRD